MQLLFILVFNGLWVLNASSARTDLSTPLLLVSIVLFILGLALRAARTRIMSVAILGIGLVGDYIMAQSGLIVFYGSSQFLPGWLLSLWFAFSWISPVLLEKFKHSRWQFTVLSAIAGPLSYYWGISFGIVNIVSLTYYPIAAIFWAALMFGAHTYLFPKKTTSMKTRSILITGSSRGIGWALARSFAKQGDTLYLVQRKWNESQLQELKTLGAPNVYPLTCDLANPIDVIALCETLSEKDIDILINNAGILTGELLEQQTTKQITDVFQLNLTSSALLIKAVLPSMLKKKRGKIVNNTSVSAYMRFPCATTYAAAKAGLLALTECLEVELTGTGVSTLALITPGIKTEMFDEIQTTYGKHFDPPKGSISAEEFADQVLKAIDNDATYLLPSGSTRIGLWVSQFAPGVFKSIVRRQFHRS